MVVIDLGRELSTSPVALLYLDANGQLQTVEKSHGGDTALGGLDMDDALLAWCRAAFRLGELAERSAGRHALRTELERGKIALSKAEETEVASPGRAAR